MVDKTKIRDIYHHHLLNTGVFSVFFDSAFFIRKGIYFGIRKYAPLIGGKVMDFGCGRKPYRSLFKNCREYVGVDIFLSDDLAKNVHADVLYDGKTIPVTSETFDNAFSSEAFELISNPDEILKEIHRTLKPGGKFLIIVPFVWEEHWLPFDFCRYSSSGIRTLLERNGFEILEQNKSTSYFETAWQMLIGYIYQNLFPSIKALKLLFTLLFIFPLNIIGILLNFVLPDKKARPFYHNNIVLSKKMDVR